MSWNKISKDDSIHVVPHGDIGEHTLGADGSCICVPIVELFNPDTLETHPDPLIIHNSYDGREYFE